MEKILTVVIAVYNMEKYLRKCLDSLIVSDDLMKSLDVVVVNDGSKDASLSIMREYETKYPDTFRVIDKENGGHGSCWNVGLKEAKGKFLHFLDSDDWFDKDGFPILLTYLQTTTCDLVITKFMEEYVEEGRQRLRYYKKAEYGKEYDVDVMDISILDKAYFLQDITVKTDNLRKIGARFREHVSYDDTPLYQYANCFVERIGFLDVVVAHYLLGRVGQSMDAKIVQKKFPQLVMAAEDLCTAYEKSMPNCKAPLQENLKRQMAMKFNDMLHMADSLPPFLWAWNVRKIVKIAKRYDFLKQQSKNLATWFKYPTNLYVIYRVMKKCQKRSKFF